jgi:hypothetical protein
MTVGKFFYKECIMAHKRLLKQALTLLALALIITLSFSACSNPTGPDLTTEPLSETYTTVKGSKTYELTITQSAANAKAKSVARAAFTPAAGDSYVLKITENGVTQISSGTVKAYSNNKFTLASSNNVSVSFEVTISGSGITSITGTITVQGGGIITGPGSLTTGASDGGGGDYNSGNNNNNSNNNSTPTKTFTNFTDFGEWLNAQPINTKDKPYKVILKISGEIDFSEIPPDSLNLNRFVNIDFSGSNFTTIEEYPELQGKSFITGVTIPNTVISVHTPLLSIAL